MSDVMVAERAPDVVVTESAAKRIAWLMQQESTPNLKLRIAVSGGDPVAVCRPLPVTHTIAPDPAQKAYYQARWPLFRQLYQDRIVCDADSIDLAIDEEARNSCLGGASYGCN